MTFRRTIRYQLRRVARLVLRTNDSPRQVAGGVAIGVMVGFTPTMGMQMITAAFLATLFRCSRIPAVALVYITNPFTALPVYGFCYLCGVGLMKPFGFQPLKWHSISVLFVSAEDMNLLDSIYDKLGQLFAVGWRGLAPLWLGCLIIGVIAAVVSYYVALRLVTGHRLLQAQRMAQRAQKRLERIRAQQPASGEGEQRNG